MGDHHVVADFDGKHGEPLGLGIVDELAEYAALRVEDIGEPFGEFWNGTAGISKASSRASARSSIACSSRCRCEVVARRDGATLPTWLETILSRRL